MKYINIIHSCLWKSHQSFIKYLESLDTGQPAWHIILGIGEISQTQGLQFLIREGCTETDSITISDTLDLSKTNRSGLIMTQATPELHAVQLFIWNQPPCSFALPYVCSALLAFKLNTIKADSCSAFLGSRTPSCLWHSLKNLKEFLLWPSAEGCCQAMVDREATLRQLTWALHLILAGKSACKQQAGSGD